MHEPVRFGFIGAGEIAARTAIGVAEAGNARLAWVMDANPALAEDLATRYEARRTDSAATLVMQPDVDAVYIAVPHFLHADMAEAAARAGKHVLLEKPMGTSLADPDRAIAACRAAGVTLGVPFIFRYNPAIQRAREWVAEGLIGKIQGTRITVLADKPESYWQGGYSGRSRSDWRVSKAKAGGGIMVMNCVHDLDALYFITGLEVERVYAEYGTYATAAEVEDLIQVVVRYHGGAIGSIEAGSAIPGARGPMGHGGTRLFGDAGQIVIDGDAYLYTEVGSDAFPARTWHRVPSGKPPEPRIALIRDYSAALLAGHAPPITGEDGRRALATIMAAYRSREEGRPVRL